MQIDYVDDKIGCTRLLCQVRIVRVRFGIVRYRHTRSSRIARPVYVEMHYSHTAGALFALSLGSSSNIYRASVLFVRHD